MVSVIVLAKCVWFGEAGNGGSMILIFILNQIYGSLGKEEEEE